MYFKDIPYKDREKALLRRQVTDHRIPHAQIFVGNEGSGALSLAAAFASYLVCQRRTESDSCGTCPACKQSHKYLYPDIHWSFPVIKADGKNREDSISDDFLPQWREMLSNSPYMNVSDWQQKLEAGNTKVNINVRECQSIVQKLYLQSFADGPKILILWMPEYLGKEGNRLLKFIEEPTPDTIIILVAEQQNLILNTILSRCQLVKVLPYTFEELTQYAVQHHHLSEDRAQLVASLAEGNMNKALHIIKGDDKDLSEAFVHWMRVAFKCDATEMLSWSNEMSSWSKDEQVQFMKYGTHFLRELLLWILASKRPNMLEKEIDIAEKMKSILDADKIQKICEVIENTQIYINRNANMKIGFMADTILIGNILKNIPNTSIKGINFVY